MCLLRGNAYAEIIRDNRGAPAELIPLHPDTVSVLRIPNTRRIVYDVSGPDGGTRRLVADEMLHLKDRSDDGICRQNPDCIAREKHSAPRSARKDLRQTLIAIRRDLSGVLQHPLVIGDEAVKRVADSFRQNFTGSEHAGKIAVLEEGMTLAGCFSVSPQDAEMLESRRFASNKSRECFAFRRQCWAI